MDTGQGRFVTVESSENLTQRKKELEKKHPTHGGWFREGEIIIIRGSKFRIKNVKPNELRLKLLPKESGILQEGGS
jgi:hypothetical protein